MQVASQLISRPGPRLRRGGARNSGASATAGVLQVTRQLQRPRHRVDDRAPLALTCGSGFRPWSLRLAPPGGDRHRYGAGVSVLAKIFARARVLCARRPIRLEMTRRSASRIGLVTDAAVGTRQS